MKTIRVLLSFTLVLLFGVFILAQDHETDPFTHEDNEVVYQASEDHEFPADDAYWPREQEANQDPRHQDHGHRYGPDDGV